MDRIEQRGQRGSLSLPVVLDSAVTVIERDGANALSMRRLGRELGVEAMSLYRYIPNFDALLDAVVDRSVEELLDDPKLHADADDDWREFLSQQAHGVRDLALAHPQVFPLIATRPPAAPWLRPPLRSLRWVDTFLAELLTRGFTEEGAVAAYRAFTSFLLGHLLLEVSAHGVQTGPVPDNGPPSQGAELGPYPTIERLAPKLGKQVNQEEFDEALGCLMLRLARWTSRP